MTTRFERFISLRDVPAARKFLLVVFGVLLLLADLLPYVGLSPDALSFEIELVMGLTFLALAFSDRVDAQRRTAWRNHGLAIAIALLVSTAGVEAATRWIFRNVTTSADSGSYFSRAWAHSVPLNGHGFRERHFDTSKPPHVYRIAVVGDSFTFGNGLPEGARYSNLLEAWLPDIYEVLNFGTPGDNTPQHLDSIASKVLPANPEFVLLQWFVNDVEGNDVSGRPRPWRLVPHPDLHRWLNRHSALYAVANMRWAEIQVALGLFPSYADYLTARLGDPGGADAQLHARLLRDIITTTRQHGADIGIVLFPDAGPALDASYPFAFLHDRVLEVCREEGIPCLDLRRDFAAVKDRRTLWVSPFDHHPSARANEIAAVKILEVFEKEWTRD